jgi:hypothetical protein
MTPLIAMPAARSRLPEPVATGDARVPALPVLSTLLHGARRSAGVADWRCGVLSAIGMPDAGQCGTAMIAACALPEIRPGSGICMAAPVHVVAGMSRMFLGPPESFSLDPARREELRLAFNSAFAATDLRLHSVGSGWVLQSPVAAAASDGSPESLLGSALERGPALSEAGRSLRRLGAEAEMWLATLPFNVLRAERGEPPINSIWFWSGATTRPVPAPQLGPGGVFTNVEPDAWVTGLASLCDLPVRQARSWSEVRDTPGALVILQPPLPGDVMRHMAGWERDWFEPVRQDLESGHLTGLQLHTGRDAWQLPAPRVVRWLRRARPWWQVVSA